ncbi:MAG TPA: D-aminoacyl-tRNA deacylase [Phycisphaerae bacterium]|jgi:D-tyrosyl-tRNA(Tyr) deacylase
MRAIVQRVSQARVIVSSAVHAEIGPGLLVYLGVATDDGPDDVRYVADKIRHLRIFADAAGAMNIDIADAGGSVLLVSAFTLLADARKGRRPAFIGAAPADAARAHYEACAAVLRDLGLRVELGAYRADMQVEAVNDGPVCILLDSKRLF